MTIPFYKLQLAGNGFILVDLEAMKDRKGLPDSINYGTIAQRFCDRRFGIGGAAVIFLSGDNTVRIFNSRGLASQEADDAYLCASRFAFDSGRVSKKQIIFKTPRDDKIIDVLGAHDFRIAMGAPFALLGGRVIAPGSNELVETIERDGIRTAYSALHIHEDAVIAFPQALGVLNYASYTVLLQKAFPGKNVLPVIARPVTRDTILVRTNARRESSCCAAAATALTAAVCAGITDNQAVVMFQQTGSDGQPDNEIAQDKDNSRRLAVVWDTQNNELYAIGSGGYIFEGKFDIQLNRLTTR